MVIILIFHSIFSGCVLCERWTGGELVIVEELDGGLVAPRSLFLLFSGGGFWAEAITIIFRIFPYCSIWLFKFHSQYLSYWSVSINADGNCNTGMITHCKVMLLLLDQTRASSAMLILIGRLFGFQFCILPYDRRKNKNGALNKSYFQKKWYRKRF